MNADLKKRMIALADALAPLANDAAQIHHDLRAEGEWGTGVTTPLATRLADSADALRDLVRLDGRTM